MKNLPLSVGKRRGLISTSTPEHIFTILAFDHRQSFVNTVAPELDGAAQYCVVASAKLDVVRSLSPSASGVLLDPLYGAPQSIARHVLPSQTGLLVAVEKSGYSGDKTARLSSILSSWSVEKIKKMGADGVKLLIYYHPDAGELTRKQEELTMEIARDCREHDIAFFLEALSYSLDAEHPKGSAVFAEQRPELISRLAERLSTFNPDVLKIEFPIDAKFNAREDEWLDACRQVSRAAACPWTVLSAGVNFDVFAHQVEAACKGGASGFIGGRAIWKEGFDLQGQERLRWLQDTASRRLEELSDIASRHATPWTDYFPAEDVDSLLDWYRNY